MLEGLDEKAARTAAGVVDDVAQLRVNHAHHGADNLAGREELASIVSLLAHLEKEPLVNLGEREDVGGVYRFVFDGVNLVEHIEEVLLGVDANTLDA